MEIIAPSDSRVVEIPGQPPGPASCFGRSLAVVIGVDRYGEGIAPLRSAAADARMLAVTLARDHGFEAWLLIDEHAGLARLLALLREDLPAALGPDDRLLFYFAGHGIAVDGDAGPEGYLVPAGAHRNDRSGFLPMQVLHDELAWLPVRHALITLDCCFSGAFRWSSLRDVEPDVVPMFRERYERHVASPAWQVLTSASHDQLALDGLANDRGEADDVHSPFARALIDGLTGAADYTDDGVVTADELLLHVREHAAPRAEAVGRRQVPQLFPLERHAGGQFVFQVPGRVFELESAPSLDERSSPYRGLASYGEADRALFFGRGEATSRLVAAIEKRPLTVVVGPSGSGKSSLVHAGAIPVLRSRGWTVLSTQRTASGPLAALGALARELGATGAAALADPRAAWRAAVAARVQVQPDAPWLVVIDQLEELSTHRILEADRAAVLEALAEAIRRSPALHVVVTVRSDAEPPFHDTALARWWTAGRFATPALNRDELREVIEKPAAAAVLCFEPARLVEQLLDDVALVPAPLPLLSFGLSELYRRCWLRWQAGERDRTLRERDFSAMGSVARALMQTATTVHDALVREDPAYAVTIRNVFIRMVAVTGGERARRRVSLDELIHDDPDEVRRTGDVLQRFHEARLIALATGPGEDGAMRPYAEPMHDELIRGWGQIGSWLDELDAVPGTRALLGAVTDGARAWQAGGQPRSLLWSNSSAELAEALGRRRPFVFNAREARFVRHSVALRRAQRSRLIGGLVSASVVLAAIGGVALWQRAVATDNAERATINEREATRQSQLASNEAGRARASADEARRNAASAVASEEQARQQEQLARQAADHERRARELAEARQFAAQSEASAADHPTDSLRMAAAAASSRWSDALVQQALYDSVARLRGWELYHHSASVTALAVRDDGELVASAASDGSIAVVRASDGAIVHAARIAPGASIERLWFLPGDRIAALGSHRLIVESIRGPAREPAREPDRWSIDTDTADVSGARLAVARSGRTVEVWTLGDGAARSMTSFDVGSAPVTGVSWDGTGSALLVTSTPAAFDIDLQLWEVDEGRAVRAVATTRLQDNADRFTLSGDGSFAFADRWSDLIQIDRQRGTMTPARRGEEDSVIRTTAQRIVVGRLDNTIGIFDRGGSLLGTPVATLRGHRQGTVESGIEQLEVSHRGTWLASIGQDAGVFVWRLADLERRTSAPPAVVLNEHDRGGHPSSSVSTVAFSRDERLLVTGGLDGHVRAVALGTRAVTTQAPRPLADPAADEPLAERERGSARLIRDVATTDDGRWLASRRRDGRVCAWTASGDEHRCQLPPRPLSGPDVEAGPGVFVAVAGMRRIVDAFPGKSGTLWTVDDRALRAVPLADWSAAIRRGAASSDRKWLAGLAADAVTIWSLTDQSREPSPQSCRSDPPAAEWAGAEALGVANGGTLVYVLNKGRSGQLTVWRTGKPCTRVAAVDLPLPAPPSEAPYNPKWSISLDVNQRWLVVVAGSYLFVVPVRGGVPAGPPVLLRTRGGELPFLQENAPDHAVHVALSPDGTWVAAGREHKGGCLWDLTRSDVAACARELDGQTDSITALAFSRDSARLALGSYGPDILVWDLRDRAASRLPLRLPSSTGWNLAVAFGNEFLVAATPGGVEVWPLSWSRIAEVVERILGSSGTSLWPGRSESEIAQVGQTP